MILIEFTQFSKYTHRTIDFRLFFQYFRLIYDGEGQNVTLTCLVVGNGMLSFGMLSYIFQPHH